jgi:Bacterial aa3 type cytochrome c oxidase subunit IV
MTIDAELQRHRATWHGFTQFLKIGTTIVIVVLAGMAIFLL